MVKNVKKDKRLSREWDSRADSGYVKLEWVNSGELLEEFIKFIRPRKKDISIDLGTGTGKIAEKLSEKNSRVYAIDYSQKMLDLAPKRKNISYVCADAKNLNELELGMVDKIVARMVFHHLNSCLSEVLESSRQMLLPKGSIFLCEGIPPSDRAYENWKETNIILENDRVFNTPEMWVNLFKKKKFNVSKTKTMAIKNLSTRKWLESRGESKKTIDKIISIRKSMNENLKKDWNARVTADDVYVDTYWFFLKADV